MVSAGESGDMKIGPVAGVTVDYGSTENLFLLSGLDFSVKEFKDYDEYCKVALNPLYLQVPIHAAYKFSVGYDFGLANINDFSGDDDCYGDNEEKIYNRNLFITVGLRF